MNGKMKDFLRNANSMMNQISSTSNNISRTKNSTQRLAKDVGLSGKKKSAPAAGPKAKDGGKPQQSDGWTCACGNVSQSKFCGECGAQQKQNICTNCDAVVESKFCPDCGGQVQ